MLLASFFPDLAQAAPRETVELSVRSSSPVDAKCAFVRSFEEEEWTSPEGLERLLGFAANREMFFPAAHLATYYTKVPVLVESLLPQSAPVSKPLAAAAIAFVTLGDSLEREKQQALKEVSFTREEEEPATEAGKGAGKKAKRGRKATAVPAVLFDAKSSPVTLELAVLAAAYGADASVRPLVDAAPLGKEGSGMAGAKLLYQARLGGPLDAALVAAAFAPARSPSGGVTSATPELANYNLLLPKEAYACEALGVLKAREHIEHLHRMLAHVDIRVQVEAVRALRKIGARSSLPFLGNALATCDWPVLVEICAALAAVPAKESIPPLLSRLHRETGRFRLELNHALSCIAGTQEATTAADWQTWWEKQGAAFEVDEARSKEFRGTQRVQSISVPPLGSFYGLPICSDRFAYVVDSSNSMKGSKMESLRSNLRDSIIGLAEGVHFCIVDFGGTVESMNRNRLTDSRRTGIDRLGKMQHSQGTRVYDALELGTSIEGVDTLFLLTDGAPVKGQLNRWHHLDRAMTIMNRYRPLAICTVAFQPSPANKQSLQLMADENCGLTIEAQ